MLELTAQRARIFRITHIENVPWILANGISCRNAGAVDPDFVQIGNPDLIQRRARRTVPIEPGGTLDDYVPFYFTPFSPMLFNIKTGWSGITQRPMRDLVILVSSLRNLTDHGVRFIFSDRHAYLQLAEFSSSLEELDTLDWRILQNRDFQRDPNDPGTFERYQAEALIHRHLPVAALDGVVCHGPQEEARLREIVHNADVALDAVSKPAWYF